MWPVATGFCQIAWTGSQPRKSSLRAPKCVQDTGPLGGESQRLHMFLLDFNVPGVAESSLSNICVAG